MSNSRTENAGIPPEFLAEADELVRGVEVLPDRAALAHKLWQAREEGRPLRVKLGVDPTASDLHLGHAVVLGMLSRFQAKGHQAVLIIGGVTARLGDPTGRNSARPSLTKEEVAANAKTYLDQVGLVLDLAGVEVLNNSEWLAAVDLPRMLELAALVTANQLLAKEGFGARIEDGQPLGLHELFYPVLQGFDSVEVKADVEIGGSDQRFNILMGRKLQPHFGQEPQVAVLVPLIEGTDGKRKMSKSFGNAVGLKDSPDVMFGKIMRIGDELIVKFFTLATTLDGDAVEEIRQRLQAGSNPKDVKEELAFHVVRRIHGEGTAAAALSEWRRLHSRREAPDAMPSHLVAAPQGIVDLLIACGLASSKNQARRFIQEGGVRVDGEKLTLVDAVVAVPPAGGTVLQHGRRRFVRLVQAK